MEDIIIPGLRAVIIYLVLLLVTRIMGRKMISQMTFFDFVIGILIGSVAANTAIGPYNVKIISGITVLIVLAALVLIIGLMHIKSFRFRKLVNSEPVIVIGKGQIIDKNMQKIRFSIDELTALLREKNVFNIADVEFAIFECNGKLSVLPKSHKQPLKPADMNIPTAYQGLTKDVIIDGNIMKENLDDAKQTKEWLLNQLQTYGIDDPKDVFYAGIDSSQTLYVSRRNSTYETEGKYGIE